MTSGLWRRLHKAEAKAANVPEPIYVVTEAEAVALADYWEAHGHQPPGEPPSGTVDLDGVSVETIGRLADCIRREQADKQHKRRR